jgi:hypothetical protein
MNGEGRGAGVLLGPVDAEREHPARRRHDLGRRPDDEGPGGVRVSNAPDQRPSASLTDREEAQQISKSARDPGRPECVGLAGAARRPGRGEDDPLAWFQLEIRDGPHIRGVEPHIARRSRTRIG